MFDIVIIGAGIRPKIWLNENPMPDFYISHEADKGYPGWVNFIGIESRPHLRHSHW